jgi:hypothetical protein
MKQNRTLPYGYRIEAGRISVDHAEAEVIRRIYRSYAEGMSYKAIAESLTAEGIRYMPDKPTWNKNMVARILQNENYLGTEKYPPIIEETLCQKAKLAQKPYTSTESKDIKDIKPLLKCAVCGKIIKRRLKRNGEERWYCEEDGKHVGIAVTDEAMLESIGIIWHRLMENLSLADTGEKDSEDNTISLETIRMKNEIDQALKKGEINEGEIISKILELASLRYDSFDTPLFHNRDLMQKLRQTPKGLHMKAVLDAASEIRVGSKEVEALVLKNGKIIEKGEGSNGHSNT